MLLNQLNALMADAAGDAETMELYQAKLAELDAARRANAPSTVVARFSWNNPGDIVDQPLADACLTLEHFVDWK